MYVVGKAQWKGPKLEGDISVSVTFYFATKRRRDLDNQNKLILDALTGIAWDDDSQIAELHLYRAIDVRYPCAEIRPTALAATV
jgi:Holliday junction resolvase RusA-like endonuclease